MHCKTPCTSALRLSPAIECATGRGLRHTATNCNKLQHTKIHPVPPHFVLVMPSSAPSGEDCNTLQRTATHCNTLQHTPYLHASSESCPRAYHRARTATHYNTLQHNTRHSIPPRFVLVLPSSASPSEGSVSSSSSSSDEEAISSSPKSSERIAALMCVAVCCSVLQCVAVCCSVLRCVAVCCSV